MAPHQVAPNSGRGSDNGTMYTSEYFIMLKKNSVLTEEDKEDYEDRIEPCIDLEGMLNRAPNDSDQEGPDDYYGVLNGCMELGNVSIPRRFLKALIRNLGFLNNSQPEKWTLNSFLARQMQLTCCMVNASFPSWVNPLHWLVRILASPLYLYSAICLLVSCIGTDTGDTDARRLAWHLGNNVGKRSLLCWLAYKVWLRRLYKDYAGGMSDVAKIYYGPAGDNAYSRWWRT